MNMERARQKRLHLFIFIVTLLIFISLFIAFYYSSRHAYLEQNERLVTLFVDHEAESYLQASDFTEPNAASEERIERFKKELRVNDQVLEITLFSLNGTVINSDDEGLIGERYSIAPLQRAKEGNVGRSIPSEIHEKHGYKKTVESFIPIFKEETLVGVVSIHQALTELENIFSRLILVLGSFFVLSIALFTLIINLLLKETTTMEKEQKALKKQNKKLDKKDKLKNEFIRNMNHEIRNPLTAIKAYTQFIKDGDMGNVSKEQEEGLTIIEGAVESLENTINNMLDFQKLEAGIKLNIGKESVEEIIEPVVKEMKPQLQKKNLKFHLHVAMGLPEAKCDKMQTRGVLRNLMSNAIKFTEKGSISISITSDGKYLRFSVSDTGVGIKKEKMKKLFNQFYQVEQKTVNNVKGSGLGLSIVKKVVEQQHGNIYVESEEGKGSTFSFTVPRA